MEDCVIKHHITHAPFPLPPLQHVEACAIRLSIGGLDTLLIVVYDPPDRRFYEADYTTLLNLHPVVFIAGDLNAKHAQ